MCPICIATAAWLSAGAGSTGGLAALLVNRHRSKLQPKMDPHRRVHEGRGGFAPLGPHSSAPRELLDHICLNRCR